MKTRKRPDIVRPENFRMLKMRIAQIENFVESKEERELRILELLVDTLVAHGKPKTAIYKTAEIAEFLAMHCGFDDAYREELSKAALVYDIGNILIDNEVYEKEDALSFEEFSVIKNHTTLGYNILSALDYPVFRTAARLSLQHHEWYNGGGYPHQLHRDRIDIASRIVSVADNIAILSVDRPGRHAWYFEHIVEYIRSRSEIEFDPKIVDKVLRYKEDIEILLYGRVLRRGYLDGLCA